MTDSDAIRRELELLADEELVAILRDRNEGQWRPEVFDIVVSILESRGISTSNMTASDTEDLELDPEASDVPGFEDLVTVAGYTSYVEAHADRLALEQSGIKAWVTDEIQGVDYGIGTAARLRVCPHDFNAALEILEAPSISASDLPPELAQTQCPRCGSRNVTENDELLDALDPLSGVPFSSTRRVWFYQCTSCNHKWSE